MADGLAKLMGGLLVVRRINWFLSPPTGQPVPDRVPAVRGCSHDEILRRYRGIEGDAWPDGEDIKKIRLEDGLASCEQFDLIYEYYSKVRGRFHCDLIHCWEATKGEVQSQNLPSSFNFCGFDYGYYLSEDNHYSSLFNEIIYGKYEELRSYAKLLNESLLFPSKEIINRLGQTRKSLVKDGADLETCEGGEVLGPIAIHAPSASSH
jgi:hypothetical protein